MERPWVVMFIALMTLSPHAWGASGTVTITAPDPGQPLEVTGNFVVEGTVALTEDSTPVGWAPPGDPSRASCPWGPVLYPHYWEAFYRLAAELRYQVDGVDYGRIGEVPWPSTSRFRIGIGAAALPPDTDHLVTVSLVDIYGARCPYAGSLLQPYPVQGAVVTSATLPFRVVSTERLTRLALVAGAGQTSAVGTALAAPLVVQVTDRTGRPVAGVGVTWAITGPDGHPAGSVDPPVTATDPDGRAQTRAILGSRPGPYRITATCPSCTSGSPIVFEATAVGCEGLSIDLWPTEVYPAATGGISTSVVTARVAQPTAGCAIAFEVEPRSSEGHDHGVHPRVLGGTLFPMMCPIAPESSLCQVIYSAPQIAGEEQLTVILKQGTTEVERQTATMRVRVPGLEALSGSPFGIWWLTGQTGGHGSNHFGTPHAIARIQAMATVYFDLYGESIGVNDMSLSGGGLFDHRSTWAPPHHSHRTGTSVDIDRCAQTRVKQFDLDRIAKKDYGGKRIVERALAPLPCDGPDDTPRIHYEFR